MQLDQTHSSETSTHEEVFLQRYEDSRLLTLDELANVLRRKPRGLRVTLGQDNELSRKLNRARVKIGRRVLYRATTVAEVIADLTPETV